MGFVGNFPCHSQYCVLIACTSFWRLEREFGLSLYCNPSVLGRDLAISSLQPLLSDIYAWSLMSEVATLHPSQPHDTCVCLASSHTLLGQFFPGLHALWHIIGLDILIWKQVLLEIAC